MEKLYFLPLLVIEVLVLRSHCITLQFSLPGGPLSETPGLQVDSQGRTFVAAGNRLYRLNRDLVLQQTVSLSSPAVGISLNSDGEWLVVCTRISCSVYNTSDLNSVIATTGIELGVRDRVAVFTAGDTYYVGNVTPPTSSSNNLGEILLRQYGSERNNYLRSQEYQTTVTGFNRLVFYGFTSGEYSYFVVLDRSIPGALRVMRVCHVTNCTGLCFFNALYEENFACGSLISSNDDDRICGVSLVEDFGGSSGASIVLSRCRGNSRSSNQVCAIKVADIDSTMERRYNECRAGSGSVQPTWSRGRRECMNFQLMGFCNFGTLFDIALDNSGISDPIPQVDTLVIVNIGMIGPPYTITASVPLKVDGFSLMVVAYVAYSSALIVGNFTGKFIISNASVTLNINNVFDVQTISFQVDALQWQRGLDYVLAASTSEVFRIPAEVCFSNSNCSSCLMEDNPLCGWCVVENKCSRQSQCRDGDSTSSTRWIPSSGLSADTNTQCIMNTISPDQFVLDNQQILNVTVGGPGLPANLNNETYMCHFEDSRGRFNITVPAMEVDPLTQYTCDIINQTFIYGGVQAVMHFNFMSSLVNVPFDRTDNALTIYNCNATNSCNECVEIRNACGWCVINKLCRGTAQGCTNTSNFLQLDTAASFQEVCPLLDLENGATNYTQHVRAQPKLHLTTKNLPNIVPGYSYMCLIRNTIFNATRNNETSLTCQVGNSVLPLTSSSGMEVTDIGIIWNGPAVNHRIDTINAASLTLYDCRVLATDCSSCIASRDTPGFECGWCDHAICSISEECRQFVPSNPFIIIGEQCPAPVITGFSPSSGPPDGGTILTIRGRDLGVVFSDFMEAGSITVGGVICTPFNMDYISGVQVLCRTGSGMGKGAQRVEVNLVRDAGRSTGRHDGFMVVLPTVSSVEPAFGPMAGGTRLTINGTGLDIGTSTRITPDESRGLECRDIVRTSTQITCTSANTSSPSSSPTPLVVRIDAQNISEAGVVFEYRNNPNFISIQPKNLILSGGLTLYFIGNDLDVSQNPQLTFGGTIVNCSNVNNTHLSCITPPLPVQNTVMYLLRLDNAPPPDPTVPGLQLSVMPDPSGLILVTRSVPRGSNSTIVQIDLQNLGLVDASDIRVSIAGQVCKIRTVTDFQILCVAPADPGEGVDRAMVVVMIGQNLTIPLPDRLLYDSPAINNPIPTHAIVPAVVIPVVVVFLCCLILIIAVSYRYINVKGRRMTYEMTELKSRTTDKSLVLKSDLSEFISQLSFNLIIPSSSIRILDISLGQGQFGVVYKAHLVKSRGLNDQYTETVAVKILRGMLQQSDVQSVLSEVCKMQDLSHPNVMTLVGVCADSVSGPSIVMPYMGNGSLLDYLKKERTNLDLDYYAESDEIISVRKLLLRMCHQISLGMSYLALQKIIHRDLAARNCMLDSKGIIKVADFGLSEDVYNTGYFRQNKDDAVRLPFKWMAPESLEDGFFSEKTDVWSFGVTCWEVFSFGRSPYPAVDPIDLPRLLREGTRLECPNSAASATEIYAIMCKCWKSPEERPTFEELSSLFDARLQSIAGYLELKMVLEQPQDENDVVMEENAAYGANKAPEPQNYEVPVIVNPLAIDKT